MMKIRNKKSRAALVKATRLSLKDPKFSAPALRQV